MSPPEELLWPVMAPKASPLGMELANRGDDEAAAKSEITQSRRTGAEVDISLQALRWTQEHFFQTIEFMRTHARARIRDAIGAPSGGGGLQLLLVRRERRQRTTFFVEFFPIPIESFGFKLIISFITIVRFELFKCASKLTRFVAVTFLPYFYRTHG